MTAQDWDRLRELFGQAIERPAAVRASFLDEACGQDDGLRREVEALVRAHDSAGAFLEPPAAAQFPLPAQSGGDDLVGRRVGPFRVTAEIGRGGMGAVYRAEREGEDYTQSVALKIVPAGLASAGLTARFRQERRILARLEHPSIARLIDAGATEDGRPYYAMEFVDGRPLDEYCVANGLGLRPRLELFCTVCDAVAYAHRNLVVHRDLKPGNIFVSAGGTPKLLDFGIAKLLSGDETGAPDLTGTGMPAMTPEFASPEQVRGEPATTSTDVYALGVLLYILVSGRRPYELTTRSPEEVVRVVCQEEPRAPSAAASAGQQASRGAPPPPTTNIGWRIDADLDTITLKALRKAPDRRYASAADLSEDIRRYLAGLPVRARPDTIGYRASRFVTRHRGAVAAGAVALISLIGGLVATTYQAQIANANRRRAEKRFEDLRELARANLFELHDAIRPLPGSAAARHLLIQRSVRYLDRLSAESAGNRGLRDELALGYERIALLEGNFSGPGIGDSRAAVVNYRKALAIREALVRERPDDGNGLAALRGLLQVYVPTLQFTGHTAEALTAARRALELSEAFAHLRPADSQRLTEAAAAHFLLALVTGGQGSSGSTRDLVAAIDHDRHALALLADLPSAGEPSVHRQILMLRLFLGFHLQKARAFDEATRELEAILLEDHGPSGVAPEDRHLALNYRGVMYERAGDQRKAQGDYEVTLRLAQARANAEPGDLQAQIDLAIAEAHVGTQTARLGRLDSGRQQLDAAIRSAEGLLAANPTMTFYAQLLVVGYAYQAELLSAAGDQRGAESKYRSGLAKVTELHRADPADLESPLSIAKFHAALGVVQGRAFRYGEAARELTAARDRLSEVLRLRPDDAEAAYVSRLIADDTAALDGCAEGRACAGVGRLRLPTLLN